MILPDDAVRLFFGLKEHVVLEAMRRGAPMYVLFYEH